MWLAMFCCLCMLVHLLCGQAFVSICLFLVGVLLVSWLLALLAFGAFCTVCRIHMVRDPWGKHCPVVYLVSICVFGPLCLQHVQCSVSMALWVN